MRFNCRTIPKNLQEKLENLEQLLAESEKISVKQPAPANLEAIDFSQVRSNMCQLYYRKAVEKIKRYIYDGDVYQVNFSQRFECDYTAKPIDLFQLAKPVQSKSIRRIHRCRLISNRQRIS